MIENKSNPMVSMLKFSLFWIIGVKVKRNKNDVKIYGNPNLELKGNFNVKKFKKDHRVFMMSCIAALTLGGKWKIYDKESINSSFPEFIKLLRKLGAKLNWKEEKI